MIKEENKAKWHGWQEAGYKPVLKAMMEAEGNHGPLRRRPKVKGLSISQRVSYKRQSMWDG